MLEVLTGDALERLRELPAESVHCCVTSPPYWGLRDYGTGVWEGGDSNCDHTKDRSFGIYSSTLEGGKSTVNHQREPSYRAVCGKCGSVRADSQLGLEKTPEEYVAKMVEVFREVRRVLRKDGTLWLNLGDSYAGSGKGGNPEGSEWAGFVGNKDRERSAQASKPIIPDGLKPKDLCGIPWRVAFALQADGWWLRSDVIEEVEFYCPCGCGYVMQERVWRHAQDREIIWKKPNPMPESVTDRPTKAHEYLFLLTKSANYFYDAEAIKEKQAEISVRRAFSNNNVEQRKDAGGDVYAISGRSQNATYERMRESIANGESQFRNKRSVWTISTQPYPEAHFATFPEELPKLCILAGTSAKGCCAKCGAPWERIVETDSNMILRNHDYFEDGVQISKGKSRPGGFCPNTATLGWTPTCSCNLNGNSLNRQLDGTADGIRQPFNNLIGEKSNEAALKSTSGGSQKLDVAGQPKGNAYQALPDQTIPCTVLDPFAGSGTTGMVAIELGRKAILIELNPKYIELIKQRCNVTPGLALA